MIALLHIFQDQKTLQDQFHLFIAIFKLNYKNIVTRFCHHKESPTTLLLTEWQLFQTLEVKKLIPTSQLTHTVM